MPLPKDPIKIEEWKRKQSESHKGLCSGENHPLWGKHRSKDTKIKISNSNKKVIHTKEWNAKVSAARTGSHHTLATKQKLSLSARNKPPVSIETRNKLSVALKGKPHITKGRPLSEAHKQSISAALKGRATSETTRKKLSEAKRGKPNSPEARLKLSQYCGPKSPNWRGGISFEPYCPKFNNEFKERVRAFFGHRCVECGNPQYGTRFKNLHVHHVNYNKETCCDQSVPLFVSLCSSCHSKTHNNRLFWEYWFTEMINHIYDGKCYFTKDEMVIKQRQQQKPTDCERYAEDTGVLSERNWC